MPTAPTREQRAITTDAPPDARNGPPPTTAGERARTRLPLLGDVRTRVLVSFFVLLVVSTAASLLVLREVLLSRTGNDAQEQLTEQVTALRTLTTAGENPETGGSFEGNPKKLFNAFLRLERPLEDGALVTFVEGVPHSASGDPARELAPALAPLAAVTEPESGEVSSSAGDARFVAIPVAVANGTGVLVAAKLLSADRDRVEGAVRIAAGVSIVVTLLASLFIWLAAGRAVAPLRALARSTRNITESDLSGRVPARGSDEIAELARTYNGMLDRLQLAFADQKEFLADVGHELRTPITVIRGHLETLGDDPAERREGTAVINDELERMSRLVDDLLLLARSDRPDFLRPEPLDLDLLTHELFAKARSLGVRRWVFDGAGVGLFHADPHRLTSAVMNLAQNAVRHTSGDQPIAIGSSLEYGEARLWVRDEGEGIEPAEQERIFERFSGVAHGRTASHGAGLGLSIVKAIADAHGGRVELDSRPGSGARFTIVIPVTNGIGD